MAISPIAPKTWVQVLSSNILLLISLSSLFWQWHNLIPIIIVGLIDCYLLLLLLIAAIRSDENKPLWDRKWHLLVFPSRVVGFFLFGTFFLTIIIAFASIYFRSASQLSNFSADRFESFYLSFTTSTSLGFGDVAPNSKFLKEIGIFQIGSSINLFVGAFSLLMSRISSMR